MASDPQVQQIKIMSEWEKDESMQRLPKRLAYILRYGALKEGLQVDGNGYVDLDDLITVGLLQEYTREEVLNNVKTSVSYRDVQRYDFREKDNKTYVRAAYLRNFEKSPFHTGTKVNTLYETSMAFILNNLDDYDLEDFPDEHIVRAMIRRLKRQKKLSSKALNVLLVPTVTRLDLEGVYLTNRILQTVWTQCPNLMAVSLKDCGYIITDTILDRFTKNLPKLEKLNLCSCTHLTPKCLSILTKRLPHLNTLHITSVPALTFDSVLDFIKKANNLKFLDVFYLKTNSSQYETLTKLAEERGVKLILRQPRKKKSEDNEQEKEVDANQINHQEKEVDANQIDYLDGDEETPASAEEHEVAVNGASADPPVWELDPDGWLISCDQVYAVGEPEEDWS